MKITAIHKTTLENIIKAVSNRIEAGAPRCICIFDGDFGKESNIAGDYGREYVNCRLTREHTLDTVRAAFKRMNIEWTVHRNDTSSVVIWYEAPKSSIVDPDDAWRERIADIGYDAETDTLIF